MAHRVIPLRFLTEGIKNNDFLLISTFHHLIKLGTYHHTVVPSGASEKLSVALDLFCKLDAKSLDPLMKAW